MVTCPAQAWTRGSSIPEPISPSLNTPTVGPTGWFCLAPGLPASQVSQCHLSALVFVSPLGTRDVSSAQGEVVELRPGLRLTRAATFLSPNVNVLTLRGLETMHVI